MRNKLLITVVVISFVIIGLMITGCTSNKMNNSKINNNDNDLIVEVNNKKFKLMSDSSLKNMHYKENYVDFYTDAIGDTRIMNYSEKGVYFFEIRINYEDKHSFEELKALMNGTESIKRVNDIDYSYYEYKNSTDDNVHAYLYNYNNATYTIIFIFKDDISLLEQVFMNNVYYE